MFLSTLYKDPARLSQVSDCGPLRHFIEGFASHLNARKFSYSTIKCHICAVEGLSLFCKNDTQWCLDDLKKTINQYLDSKILIGRKNKAKATQYGLNRFYCYMVQHHDLVPVNPIVPYHDIYEQFRLWEKNVEQLRSSTIELRSHYLIKFLHWYNSKSDSSPLSLLSHTDVEEFSLSQASKYGRSYKRSMQSTLRGFLRFCFEKTICQKDLSGAVPKISFYRLGQVPKAISEQQAQKLLSEIDCTTHAGKRVYAIVLLLYTYGVRGGQVRHLLLKDIDWHKGEIFFHALKNAKSGLFPLNAEVGNAVLDYLRQVRAQSAHPEVFLTLRAPCRPLRRSSTLSQIIRTAMSEHQITSPTHGGHCFRHAFASRLLKQGVSFKHIADLLGHRHLSTAFIYTKVDVTSLAEVGLALPEV